MTTYYSTNNLFAYTIANSTSYVLDADDYSILQDVFNRWDGLIIPDSRFEGNYTINVDISIESLDPGILGGASVSVVYYIESLTFGNTFPANADIALNYLYIQSMKNSIRDSGKSEYYYVMLHEVGHVLGIGPFWGLTGSPIASYDDNGTTKYYYYGENALREYRSYFPPIGKRFVGVPVEDDGSTGTANVHPEEGTESYISSDNRIIMGNYHPGLDSELMTGWLEASPTSTPLSRITLGFLEDIGYGVRYNLADYYRTMSEWLDLSNNANCFKSMYIDGFLDLSGGSLQTRGPSDHLLIGGDASLNGQTYLGGKLLVGTDGRFVEGTADNGATTYDICGNALNGAASYDVSGNADNGAAINGISIPTDASWSQNGADIEGEAAFDRSGQSVSISSDGTIVAILARLNVGTGLDYAGHVRVYQYDANKTVAVSEQSSADFGPVGWRRLGGDIDGEAASDQSLFVSLSSDGTIVAIGAPYNRDGGYKSGHVRVYQYDANKTTAETNQSSADYGPVGWRRLGADIDGEAAYDESGWSVSLSSDGTIVAIGAYLNDGTDTTDTKRGRVRVYQYDADSPNETDQSSADFGPVGWRRLGAYIDGELPGDESGYSVSLSSDGTIVAIGAHKNAGAGLANAGHVRVYQYDANKVAEIVDPSSTDFGPVGWKRLGADIDGEAESDYSGRSVSLSSDGTIVAIGANANDANGSASGHVRVYQYDANKTEAVSEQSSADFGPVGWRRLGGDIDGEAASDSSGYSVSLSSDGTIVAIGAYGNDGTITDNIQDNRGHVRVYQYDANKTVAVPEQSSADYGPVGWRLLGADIDGEAAGDNSGWSVSLSSDGTIVAIGAYYNDGTNGTDSGNVRVYEITSTKIYADISGGYYDTIAYNSDGLTANAATIHGTTDISGALHVAGDVSFNACNLFVGGDCSINGQLSFGSLGNKVSSGDIDFSSDISLTDRLYAKSSDLLHNKIIGYNLLRSQLGGDIDGEASGDQSGYSVSLSSDGTIVAIGAYWNDGNGSTSGHVRVYQYANSSWTQLGEDINGEAGADRLGTSVSLSSDGLILATGAVFNDGNGADSGHVRVYQYNNVSNSWSQLGGDIDGEAAGDRSGGSVSLSSDGQIVAIGATFNDGTDPTDSKRGHVRVYQYNGTAWTQLGADIDGEAADNQSGTSLSLSSDGMIVAIGVYNNDGTNGADSGHVRVYQYDNSVWAQLGADIDGEAAGDKSGSSVSLSSDGTIVAIGAIYNDGTNGADSGHVRVYQYDNTSWTQLGADIDGEAASDYSGRSVSLSSDGLTVAIGAFQNDGNGSNSGHVRVYQYNNSSWTQIGGDIDGEVAGDYSGVSVSLSSDGTIVAIGAVRNAGNGSNTGHVRVYQTISIPIYQSIHGDLSYNAAADPSFNFAADVSLNSALTVPGNILVVDGSANNYGAYTTYSNQAGTASFSVGKSASNVFNIVDQDNAGVYMASGGTTLTSTSDIRLKTDIVALGSATEKIMALKPCTYKWKTEEGKDVRPHPGFIAQETKEALPEVVHKIDHPDGDDYLGVNTTDMIPYLIKTMQENHAKLRDLRNTLRTIDTE